MSSEDASHYSIAPTLFGFLLTFLCVYLVWERANSLTYVAIDKEEADGKDHWPKGLEQ